MLAPPNPTLKNGRHNIMRMESDHRSHRNQPLVEDNFEDVMGNLYRLSKPMLAFATLGRVQYNPLPSRGTIVRCKRARQGSTQGKCSNCGGHGHNYCTHTIEAGHNAIGQAKQVEV